VYARVAELRHKSFRAASAAKAEARVGIETQHGFLLQRQEPTLSTFSGAREVADRASEAERLQLADVRNHLTTGQATATDEHDMATIAVLLIQLARLITHRQLTVRTNRRFDTRSFLKGLCHDTHPRN
jgi:CHASE3 domain sensor protein